MLISEKASMTSVFIFDIAAQTWTEQVVTDVNGNKNEDDDHERNHNVSAVQTLPSRRMSACAAVGSSHDRTSHNIVLIGGQNEVTALGDA